MSRASQYAAGISLDHQYPCQHRKGLLKSQELSSAIKDAKIIGVKYNLLPGLKIFKAGTESTQVRGQLRNQVQQWKISTTYSHQNQ
jgi:hypothetical protein